MTRSLARLLSAGASTGVGSLPHADPAAAARLTLELHPHLPSAPQLPGRDPREGMIPQWLAAFPGVSVDTDGSVAVHDSLGAPVTELSTEAHGGLLAFLDAVEAADSVPRAVKLQLTGPLTLGTALAEGGVPVPDAFPAAAELAAAWARDLVNLASRRLPASHLVVFVDEPTLVQWRDGDGLIAREDAVDLLSGTLAAIDAVTGVHVCGDGERRMALEAGPNIVGFEASSDVLRDGVALSRFLDAGGWIAWGAVPTDRPVGSRVDHWWNELVSLWCDLTRGGCDPVVLRTQSMVTPACGLAHHTEEQARQILEHCVEIGERIREQAIATRLSVGA